MTRSTGIFGHRAQERGAIVIFAAFTLIALAAICGLAIDLGRYYVVRAELAKAVDGGALAGARRLTFGEGPAEAAARAFAEMNFADGFMGTDSHGFQVDFVNGQNQALVQVSGTAALPTTLMRIVGLDEVSVVAFGEATRRPLELSLVLDTSGSLHPNFAGINAIGYLRTAASTFVPFFDDNMDKMSLVRFASGRVVPFSMGHNFRGPILGAISQFTAAGGTNSHDALSTGAAQFGSGNDGAFRALVFFTDGRPTAMRESFTIGGGTVDGVIGGYQDPAVNGGLPPSRLFNPLQVDGQLSVATPATLPSGLPATTVNILAESRTKALAAGNAARAAGATIFTIGLGNPNAGPIAQPDPLLLMALANVPSGPNPLPGGGTIMNPHYNPAQPEGAFYFAPDATGLEDVFERVAAEISVRLTR